MNEESPLLALAVFAIGGFLAVLLGSTFNGRRSGKAREHVDAIKGNLDEGARGVERAIGGLDASADGLEQSEGLIDSSAETLEQVDEGLIDGQGRATSIGNLLRESIRGIDEVIDSLRSARGKDS